MKTRKTLHVLSVFLLLAVCLMGICSAAVSVNDVVENLGPQVTLTATTDVTDPTYQWYTCDDASGANAVAIEGATNATYTTVYLDVVGTTYYMVKVNDTESAVATVTATMPTDYHVFKFNSEAEVAAYVGASGIPKTAEFVNMNGVYAMKYNATKGDAATNFPASYINNFYLQAYPYLVFSLNYDSLTTTPNNFQIRSYTDRSINGNFHFQPTKSGFVKYVVNTATSKYVGYDKSGKQVISGNTYDASNNKGKWNGKFTSFRLDFDVPAAIAGEPIQMEYMAFFPTEAAAKAYNGEMPLDDKAEEILAVFDDAVKVLSRNEYATEADIAACVEELASEADAAVADVKAGGISNAAYEIKDVTYTEGTDYDCYTFTVDVLVGDTNYKRSRIAREYKIFAIGDVNIDDVNVTVGPDATITSAFAGDDTLTYQWYTCDADGSNAVAIDGATEASYTRHVDAVETTYYKLVVNGVIESNVATFTAEMPTEPIVLKFNNKYDTAYWSTNLGYTKYLGVPIYQRAHAGNTNDDTTTITNIASYNIYLAAYPVIVVKAAYPEFPANNVDIYVGTDRDGAAPALKTGATTFQVPVGEGFMTLVFDSSTGTYKSYKADGSVHTHTTKNFGAADAAREGKLDYLRLDLSNGVNNYQKNYYFEYIGFFPTLEKANAYTGAMPADEYSNVVISAFEAAEEDGTLAMEYDEAMTEEKAEAFASELYSSISAAAVAEVKEMGVSTVDVTYTAGEYTPYTIGEKFAQNGSYTFTVSVLAGDTPLRRSYIETEVTVLLKGNQPNVFLEDLTVAAGPQVTLTPEIIPGLETTSFQWYTCDANGENAVAIEDATSESYTLYPLAGTRYYMVTVNGNENSNVMALTGTLATEPVVLRFNSEQDLANWRLNGGSDKAVTTYEGKKVFTYIPGNDGSTFFDNLSEYNDFYLQSYPYFVISANYPDYAANASVDIYIGADGYDAEYRKNHYDFNFSVSGSKPAVNHGYTKTIINATTREYKSYNANGTLICEGTGDYGFLGADTLVGKLATLRVDFSNFNAGKPCYIEYLGFFPTEEMALAYTSAMPNDADLNTIVSNVKNSITVPFAASETEATASAGVAKYAKKAIDAAAAALDKGYDAADVTVSNGVYSRPEKYGAGTYTANINVVLGNTPFGRSQASFNTAVTLNAKPEPVIMAFDTEEKVNAASVSGYLESKKFVNESSGRKFMRLVTNGGGDNYLEYTNFYDQTGKTFNFQDYPYMKMSYRRNVDRSNGDNTSEGSQIYIANRAKYYLYYPGSSSDAPYWEQLTMDMRTSAFNYYREDTDTTGRYTAGITVTNPTVLWEDQVAANNDAFHFRLTRYGSMVRTLDYEYIAFFASEEEARLYPNADRHYDTEALKAANAFNAADDVLTEELAAAAAEEYLASFNFASNYTIENAVYTASTTTTNGTYVFNVWFGADKKADYTVTVTMTLPVVPVTSVAKIGDVEFETLADAAANAKAGDTIILINDAVLTTDVTLPAGIILNGNGKSITGATVIAGGDLTFEGYTKVTTFHPGYNAPTITIGAGACLEMISGRMVIGQGATFNITGNITDAKTTNVADVTPSLIAPGASFTGAGLNFNVTNAYIKFTAYASSKNSNANGTFNFDVTNSIWEQSGSLVFSEPSSGMDPTFNFNLKDSVLNSTSHLVFAVTKGDIVIDNSLVNNGAAKQLENRSNLTIKNGSVVYALNASSQNAKNPGTTTVDNATYVGSGEFTGAEVGTGAIILKNNANVTLGTVSKANVTVDTTSTLTATKFTGDENTTITIDAAGMTEGSLATIAGDMSAFAGALTVINNDALEASVDENGNIVLTKKPVYVAKIGDVEFETLDAALDYAKAQAMTEVEIIVLDDIKFSTKVNNFAKVTFTGTNREQTIDMNIGSSFESNVQLIFNDLTVSRLDGDWLGHYTYIGGGLTYNNCKMIGLFNVTAQDTDFIGCDFYNDDTFGDGSYSIWLYNCFEGVEVNITDCTFDVYERAIKVYGNGYNGKMVLNISGTEFISRTADKTVVEMAYDQSTGVGAMELNITDSTATGFGAPEHIAGDANAWFNVEGSNTSSEVTVDDVVVYSDYVAAIGNVKYPTLQAAVNDAAENDTIVLLTNIEQADGVTITDKKLTIDLAEHTFTVTEGATTNSRNFLINGASVVTIKNGTMVAAGDTNSGTYGTVRTEGSANVTLTDLVLYNYRGNGLNIKACSGTTVSISDTVIYSQYGGGIEAAGATIELTNVTVDQKGMWIAPYNSMAISVNGGGKVTVNSGSYSTEPLTAEEANNQGTSHGSWAAGVLNSGGTLIINGGTFTNGNFGDDALATAARGLILADTGAIIEIRDGTFNALNGIIDIQNNLGDASKNPTGTIAGGTFSADPTNTYVTIKDGYTVEANENGTFGVVEDTGLSGSGTEDDPYLIDNLADLIWFRNDVNGGNSYDGKYVKLTDDINLADDLNEDGTQKTWTSIGDTTYSTKNYAPVDATKVFSGVFDGNGKVIFNLKIAKTVGGVDTQANVGLFGVTGDGAVIKNLTLTNVNINTDGRNVGALTGYAYKTTFENITVNGDIQIKGGNNVSGVGGMTRYYAMSATNISVSGNTGSAIIGNNIVGGIFAEIAPNGSTQTFNNLSVENIAITGVGGVGGIVGLLNEGTIDTVSVKNVVLTGRTDYLGNAMGRIRIGSVAGLMGGKYATIANATVENVTAKNLDENAVVLPIIGANYDSSSNATEAKIGNVYYATLTGAIAAANTNETVTLLDNVTLTGRVDIADKAITIDLNGNTITSEVVDAFGSIYVKKGATLTVTGEGTITSAGITIGTYGTVNIEGGNIVTTGEDYTALYVFYYSSDFVGTATVNGGSVNSIWNCGTLTVSGGTVDYLDTSSELIVTGGTITEILAKDGSDADGEYTITISDPSAITVPDGFVLKKIEDGKYQVVEDAALVQNLDADGNVLGKYSDFESAIAAAVADTNTARVEILGDITQETIAALDETHVLTANHNLTIGVPEGEEYTVTLSRVNGATFSIYLMENGASLTIEEGVTIIGLDIIANGFATSGNKLIINGTIYALSLKDWTSNNGIIIGETGRVVLGYGDGQLDLAYGNSSLTINGNGDMTEPQFKAGYSGTRGDGNTFTLNNTSFDAGAWFNVNGSNGTFNIDNSVFAVSGGDGAGKLDVTSTGNTFNVTNGGTLNAGVINLAEGNDIVLGAGSSINATTISGAGTISIDATGLTAGNIPTITGDASGFTGTLEITNNDNLDVIIDEEGNIVLVEKAANVAKIGDVEYETLQAAFDAVQDGETIVLLDNITIEGTTDGVMVVDSNKSVTLDLNGKTITAIDNATGNFSLFFIGGQTDGELTVKDSGENGTITLTATNNRVWNALSGIFHNRGGILNIESGTYIHNGGTDMAWVIDNSANSYGDATTTVNGGTLYSTYTAIRNRMEAYGANGNGNGEAVIIVNGGNIDGATSAIWGQAASSNEDQPAKGEISVTDGEIGTINVSRDATSEAMLSIYGGTVANIKAKAGEVKITNGTLTGALTILDANGNVVATDNIISGGTFYSDLSAYVSDGYEFKENEDDTFGVIPVMHVDGDVDDDGSLSVSDAILTLRAIATSLEIFTEEQMVNADVNGDGEVTVSDVIRMLQYIAAH